MLKCMKKREVKQILKYMNDILDKYGFVTRSDYYDLIGSKIHNYRDDLYGWVSLNGAKIKLKLFRGYVLVLPEPIFLQGTYI